MKCDDARAAYLAGEASRQDLQHLATCGACREVSAELQATLIVLDQEAVWEEPSAALEDRVVALVSGAAPGPASRRSGWWLRIAVAAAFVVVAATAAVIAFAPGNRPDWEVALPGTSAAPGATGTVAGWNEASGTRLRFQLDGLDPAPAGSFYEVWFSSGSTHISAGTFSAPGDIDMWTGIARKDYPRIWITLEPADSDESPSRNVVMDTG